MIPVSITVPREECKLLGISVTPISTEELLELLSVSLARQSSVIVAGHNLHSAYLYHTNDGMREFYDTADIVLSDGTPVVWDHKLSGGASRNQRIGSTDWIPRLPAIDAMPRIMVVGSTPESNSQFTAWMKELLPDSEVRGMPGIPWNDARAEAAMKGAREFAPQLMLIGLGMPLQESFASSLVSAVESPLVIATVGGAIDQLAGVQPNAPRWLGRLGLEWAWRLVTQPRRLWKRYLLEPWKLLGVRLSSSRKV